jgi:hypothetical protein
MRATYAQAVRTALLISTALTLLPACCVSPFIDTDPVVAAGAPGSVERETGGSLEEEVPAVQAHAARAIGAGFDMRLVRVQPGVHLDTEQLCDVGAALRLETIDAPTDPTEPSPYDPAATQRMSVRCVAPTGESWADLEFLATRASHVAEVVPGARIRVRIRRADGGFFDYPIVDFVETVGAAPEGTLDGAHAGTPASPGAAFDLRAIATDPALIGTTIHCAVAHASDIDVLDPSDVRRRSYPAGVQNRMTIRCRHAAGEEWADLIFMPSQALSALHVDRGDDITATIVSRNGGFFDYPVLQYAGP